MTPEYKAERDRTLARHAEWRAKLTAKKTAEPTTERVVLNDALSAIGRKYDRSKSIGERAKAAWDPNRYPIDGQESARAKAEIARLKKADAAAMKQADIAKSYTAPTQPKKTTQSAVKVQYSLVNVDGGSRMTYLGRQWFDKNEAETLAADYRGRGYNVRVEPSSSAYDLADETARKKELTADKRRAKKYAAEVAKQELRKFNEATRNREREEAIARAQVVAAQKRAAGEDDEYEVSLIVAEKTVPHNILMQYPSGRWGFEGYVYPRLRNKTWNTVLKACEAAADYINNTLLPTHAR